MPLTFAGRAALLTSLVLALPLRAQRAGEGLQSAPITDVRYEVTADRAALAARRIHVATTFGVASAAPVVLSMPAWTPGAYEIANFARDVSGFSAKQGGDSLRWDKGDYDTWRVWPKGSGQVTVSFDFLADTLDNAASWTRPDFALFNGTNLFLYPEGRPAEFSATVSVKTEPTWRVATSMSSAGATHVYKAS